MKLASDSFKDGGPSPAELAFCAPDAQTHVKVSANRNPGLAWSEFPAGTKSFAVICHDPDVPSVGTDVNQEGRTVSATLARVDFFHWVLVDLPVHITRIAAGEFSSSVVAQGQDGPATLHGARHGINDYTGWFAADPAMAGDYYGYDGPCPPWNDEIAHRYVFTVFALDVAKFALQGRFDGPQARDAMKGHVLAQAVVTGKYALNPAVKF